MNTSGHPVCWRGKTYHLSNLTVGVKDDYCAWLTRRMLARARRIMEPAEFLRYQNTLVADPPVWTDVADECVVASLNTPEGDLQLIRLLFGASERDLSDDELRQLAREKADDPASDYVVALGLIRESSDPKAQGPSGDTPAATAGSGLTATCGTSPST